MCNVNKIGHWIEFFANMSEQQHVFDEVHIEYFDMTRKSMDPLLLFEFLFNVVMSQSIKVAVYGKELTKDILKFGFEMLDVTVNDQLYQPKVSLQQKNGFVLIKQNNTVYMCQFQCF